VNRRLGDEELDALFDPHDQLRHIDEIFARLGLTEGGRTGSIPAREAVPA
jgi:hypothetical protein